MNDIETQQKALETYQYIQTLLEKKEIKEYYGVKLEFDTNGGIEFHFYGVEKLASLMNIAKMFDIHKIEKHQYTHCEGQYATGDNDDKTVRIYASPKNNTFGKCHYEEIETEVIIPAQPAQPEKIIPAQPEIPEHKEIKKIKKLVCE